ncbi:MAG: prepilin-type N-terminal cleavage/methylation domain-containing protein [Planctomycetes bacterium]|nr:prepilin-type N-terminal cleavage/methylation domain-containing protein [Planctomycetota bacterium]
MRFNKGLRAGFTLIELLVVIAVIAILAGLLMTAITKARWRAKVAACQSNLAGLSRALMIYQMNEGGGNYFPPWLTLLGDPRRHTDHPDHEPGLRNFGPGIIEDPRAFICPADYNEGLEGNRDSTWDWSEGSNPEHPYDEFQNPDADWQEDWNFTTDKDAETYDKVPCSYLYEFNGERCEWAQRTIDNYDVVPLSSPGDGDESRAPELEWLKLLGENNWKKVDYPDLPRVADFMRIADTNRDGTISWGEMKKMNVKGRRVSSNGVQYRLPPLEGKLPLIRCYWHVDGPAVDKHCRQVLNLNAGNHISMGYFMWQRDLDMY